MNRCGAKQHECKAADGKPAAEHFEAGHNAVLGNVNGADIPALAFKRERQHEQKGEGGHAEHHEPRKRPRARGVRDNQKQQPAQCGCGRSEVIERCDSGDGKEDRRELPASIPVRASGEGGIGRWRNASDMTLVVRLSRPPVRFQVH